MFYIAMLITSRQHNVDGDGREGPDEPREGPEEPKGEDADAAAAYRQHGDAEAADGAD